MDKILPNFLIIGAQKAGTSWLARQLQKHPDIFLYDHEIHFFDKKYNYGKGIDWYAKHFEGSGNKRMVGEKTPDYLWANGRGVEGHLPGVHINIYSNLPNIKLIAVLRNPVDRAISALNHIIHSGRVSPFLNINELLMGSKKHLVEGHGVLDYGRYHTLLTAFYDYFSAENILVLIFEEDVIVNPEQGLKKVCNFLGVDASYDFGYIRQRINENRGNNVTRIINYYLPILRPFIRRISRFLPNKKLKPSKDTIQKLFEFYKEENQKLFNLLGREIPTWKKD